MSAWDLPKTATIDGIEYAIRSDYRAVLDVLAISEDPEITDEERGALALEVFYPDFDTMPRGIHRDAIDYLVWFVAGGDVAAKPPKRKLADWAQDFPIIVGPVNRVLGYEVRSVEYLHWWTFLGAYMEVGDCLFAQVVTIRQKLARHKKLEKYEREFYRENRDLVDLRTKETDAEKKIMKAWMGGGDDGAK